jgi:hypothetical protein
MKQGSPVGSENRPFQFCSAWRLNKLHHPIPLQGMIIPKTGSAFGFVRRERLSMSYPSNLACHVALSWMQ